MNRKARRRLKVVVERKLDANLAQRACGECTACCTVLAIAELDKPIHTDCVHASTKGCGIYEMRPKSCREYECLWRIGLGTLEQRPDRLGLVISPTRPGTPGYPAALVHELWPNAFYDSAEFLREAAGRHALLLIRDGRPRSIMGPDHVILGMKGEIEKIRRLNEAARLSSKP
jgi:hypothetical protein